MSLKNFLLLLLLLSFFSCHSIKKNSKTITSNKESLIYLGQKDPGLIPTLFAPNIISKPDRYEFGCVFSKNGQEVFYAVNEAGKEVIYYAKLENGLWSASTVLLKEEQYGNNDPMLSPDEHRLYFISNRPLKNGEKKEDIDIWYVERQADGWSTPINAGDKINSLKNEYYISFTENGTMYFSSNINAPTDHKNNFDIYYSQQKKGEYQTPIRLDEAINTNSYEADVYIAPDESYIIFCANRRGGYGRGDLYISFKDDLGNWTPSKSMGPLINTEHHELCPFVTQDGKYFIYTSNQDIYWVSTDIFEGMK